MSYPSKFHIKRAVEAARECGIDVGGFEISAEGAIRVFDKRGEDLIEAVRLVAGAQQKPLNDFDLWKDRL
ncbi:hypothetical protein EWE75_04225 [Sphingomonas populi]|uniref:Uncharacterized protein n=1 Tax=Sphingomonas populi TaxID=2484750 RepID=A0A4Q6XZX6_9SPHN|nr:hypothetical protein [Sphingomonas populi]RZF65865.1 hypothetical protein EWE75_04225 [Sphingomonas populi]